MSDFAMEEFEIPEAFWSNLDPDRFAEIMCTGQLTDEEIAEIYRLAGRLH